MTIEAMRLRTRRKNFFRTKRDEVFAGQPRKGATFPGIYRARENRAFARIDTDSVPDPFDAEPKAEVGDWVLDPEGRSWRLGTRPRRLHATAGM